jgi:signal transduction histidine kinase
MTSMRAAATRSWRATLHALAGLLLGAGALVVLGSVVLVWGSAIASLLGGSVGGVELAVLYVVAALTGPITVLWGVRALTALQRVRFRATLHVEIRPVRDVAGDGALRLIRPWRSPTTWRQLGYHLLTLLTGIGGGLLVLVCWTAPVLAINYADQLWEGGIRRGLGSAVLALVLLLAAPWVAGGLARMDETAARALLGPSRSDELALKVESLARSRDDVVAATDAERRRIERDLHDGAQQRLVSLAMNLGMVRANLTDTDPARQAIEAAHDEATLALAELREFVRGLHPAVLNDRGLDAALSGIVARAPLPVKLRVDVETRCSPSVEAVAYFIVSEALTNVAKHAQATHAEVTVERAGDRLRVRITDDGGGGASDSAGSGLRGLAQRAAAVDGTLTVHSPTGGPTTISAELPCES